MINGLLWLVLFQLAGELIARGLDLPVPGAVVGMLLLFIALLLRKPSETAGVIRLADSMLRHLQLLFVPPAVGIVTYLAAIRDDALPMVGALVGSWLAGLATVALLVTLTTRRGEVEA